MKNVELGGKADNYDNEKNKFIFFTMINNTLEVYLRHEQIKEKKGTHEIVIVKKVVKKRLNSIIKATKKIDKK